MDTDISTVIIKYNIYYKDYNHLLAQWIAVFPVVGQFPTAVKNYSHNKNTF